MNRTECAIKNSVERGFGTNSNISTAAFGDCITNEPLQAIKLKKGRYSSLNKISAFSYSLKRKVNIPKGTTFCLTQCNLS